MGSIAVEHRGGYAASPDLLKDTRWADVDTITLAGQHTVVERGGHYGATEFVKSPLDALGPLKEQLKLQLWLVPDGMLVTGADGARIPGGKTIPVVVRRPGPAIRVSEREVWIAPLHARPAEQEAAQALQGAKARLCYLVRQLAYLEAMQPFYDATPDGPKHARRIDMTRAAIAVARVDIATQRPGLDYDNMLPSSLLGPLADAYEHHAVRNPDEPRAAVLRYAFSQVRAEFPQAMQPIVGRRELSTEHPPKHRVTYPLYPPLSSIATYAPVPAAVAASAQRPTRETRNFSSLVAAGLVIPMATTIVDQVARPVVVTPVPANAIPLDYRGTPRPDWINRYLPSESESAPHLASPPEQARMAAEFRTPQERFEAAKQELYEAMRAFGIGPKRMERVFGKLNAIAEGTPKILAELQRVARELSTKSEDTPPAWFAEALGRVKEVMGSVDEYGWQLGGAAVTLIGFMAWGRSFKFDLKSNPAKALRLVIAAASVTGFACAIGFSFASEQSGTPPSELTIQTLSDGTRLATTTGPDLLAATFVQPDTQHAPNFVGLFEAVQHLAHQGGAEAEPRPFGYISIVNPTTGQSIEMMTAQFGTDSLGRPRYIVAQPGKTPGELTIVNAYWAEGIDTSVTLSDGRTITAKASVLYALKDIGGGQFETTNNALYVVLKYTDGGRTWTVTALPNAADPNKPIYFVSEGQQPIQDLLIAMGLLPKAAYAEALPSEEVIFPTPAATGTTEVFSATLTPPPTEAPTGTEAAGQVELATIVPESMVCAKPEWCFNMEPKDPDQMYRDYAAAWVANPAMQKYLRELGVTPTLEGFFAFLPTSYGPDGRPYYLPGQTPQGTRIPFLLGTYVSGLMRANPAAADGVYYDGLRFLFYTLDQWENNDGGIRDYLKAVYRANTKIKEPPTIGGGTLKQYRVSEFGTVVTLDKRLLFLGGNEHKGYNQVQNNGLFGGPDGLFRPGVDPQIATAMWLTYLNFMRVAETSEINTPDAYRYTCIDDPDYCTSGITYNQVTKEQFVFNPNH